MLFRSDLPFTQKDQPATLPRVTDLIVITELSPWCTIIHNERGVTLSDVCSTIWKECVVFAVVRYINLISNLIPRDYVVIPNTTSPSRNSIPSRHDSRNKLSGSQLTMLRRDRVTVGGCTITHLHRRIGISELVSVVFPAGCCANKLTPAPQTGYGTRRSSTG